MRALGMAPACHTAALLDGRENDAPKIPCGSIRFGRNCLAQFLNRGPKSTLLALVGLVSSRHTGHLALKSLKPRYGFDYEGCACGWGNAGHEMPLWYWSFGELPFSLVAQNCGVKCGHLRQASPTPPTALEDCRKLRRFRFRPPALYLALGLKPIFQLVTVTPSAPLVKFVGALLNLPFERD